METALSTLSILPAGKEQVERFKSLLKNEILSGNSDPLKAFAQLKYIEKTITETLSDEDIENCILLEYDKYGKEKNVEIMGLKINSQEVGVKYEYKTSGDPVWEALEKQAKEIAEKKKAREKFLQAVPFGGVADPETGVIVNRPAKTSKTKVVAKFI